MKTKLIIFCVTLVMLLGVAKAYYNDFSVGCTDWTTSGGCADGFLKGGSNLSIDSFNPVNISCDKTALACSTPENNFNNVKLNFIFVNANSSNNNWVFMCGDDGNECKGINLDTANQRIKIGSDDDGFSNIFLYALLNDTPYNVTVYYYANQTIATYIDGGFVGSAATPTYGITPTQLYLLLGVNHADDVFVDYLPRCSSTWACNSYTNCIIKPFNHKDCTAVADSNNCYVQTGEPANIFQGNLADYTSNDCTVKATNAGAIVFSNQQVAKQQQATTNSIEQLILNFRSWLLNLLGLKP